MTFTCEYPDCDKEIEVVVRFPFVPWYTRLYCRECWEQLVRDMVLLEIPASLS